MTGNNAPEAQREDDGAKPYLQSVSPLLFAIVVSVLGTGIFIRIAPWAVFSAALPLIVAVMALTIPRRPHGYDFTFDDENYCAAWNMETKRLMRFFNARVLFNAMMYSFVLCLVVLASTYILQSWPPVPTVSGTCLDPAKVPCAVIPLVALAVLAATGVSFTLDLGYIVVRAASRDLTAPMLAAALKRFLWVLCGALLLVLLLLYVSTGQGIAITCQGKQLSVVVVGATLALFGERATGVVSERAAQTLGMRLRVPESSLELKGIKGLSDSAVERLLEEGIDSIHALAFYSTPRLFLATPYSLARVCDLQDQAALLDFLDVRRVQILADQFGVRGIIEASDFGKKLLAEAKTKEDATRQADELKELRAALGWANENQMRRLLELLAASPLAAALRVYKSGRPRTG